MKLSKVYKGEYNWRAHNSKDIFNPHSSLIKNTNIHMFQVHRNYMLLGMVIFFEMKPFIDSSQCT
jgi:hypothetical protein